MAAHVTLAVEPVRYAEEPPALRSLAGFMPRVLEACLYRYRWLDVVIDTGGVQREKAGEQAERRSDFVIQLSLVGVRDQFRMDLSVTNAASGAMVFGDYALFSETTLLDEVARLAEKLGDELARRTGAAAQRKAVIAVVSPFRMEGDAGRLQTLSMLLPGILASKLSSEQIEGVRIVQPVSGASAGGEYDATVVGSYSVAGDLLTVSASLEQRRGPTVGVTFATPAGEAFHAPGYLARRVSELIRGRVEGTGRWREEPEWNAANAGYESYVRRAEEYAKAGERLPVIVFYRKALEIRPGEPALRLALSEIYMAAKDYGAALSECQAVLRDRPGSPGAVYGTGRAYSAQGDSERAETAFREALKLAPNDTGIAIGSYKGLGDLEFLQGRNDQALEFYGNAQRIAEAANVVDVEIYRSAANAYRAAKRTGEAIAYLENAAGRLASRAELKNELAGAYNEQGEDLLNQHKYAEARKAYERALHATPADQTVLATALGGVGICAAIDGEPGEALDYLRKSASMMPAEEHYHRAMGYAYHRLGQDNKAVEEYNRAIAIEPTSYSHQLLADAYVALNQPRAAEASIKETLRLQPDDYSSYTSLGRLLRDRGEKAQAIEAFQKAQKLAPEQAEPYRELAWMYREAKNFRQAIEVQNKAAQISSSPEDYFRLGSYYKENNDPGHALGPLRKATELDEGCGEYCRKAYLAIGEILTGAQRAEYLGLLERGVERNPSQGWLLERAGEAYFDDGRYEDAIRMLKRAVGVTTGAEVPSLLARAYVKAGQPQLAIPVLEAGIHSNTEANSLYDELAEIHRSRGDMNSFKSFLRKLVEDKPQSVTALVRLADRLRMERAFDEAIPLLQKASALDPKNEWPHRVLGYAFLDREDYGKAAPAFEAAIGLEPKAGAFQGLAKVYYATEKYDKTIEDARKALGLDPDYVDAYLSLADALRAEKKPGEAVAAVSAARVRLPKSSALAGALAISFFDLGNLAEAEKAAREALTLAPKYGWAHYVLGIIQWKRKAYDRALGEVKRAIEDDPGYEGSYPLLAKLYHESGSDAEGVKTLKAYLEKSPTNVGLLSALGGAEHDKVGDFDASYVHEARAYELAPQSVDVQGDFAEANLTTGRFAEAEKLAKAALRSGKPSPQWRLSLSLISISALLLQGQRGGAFSELRQFFEDYRKVPADYERTWEFTGTKNYIAGSTRLTEAEKNLLLGLITILESQDGKKGQATADRLESSLEQIFVDLHSSLQPGAANRVSEAAGTEIPSSVAPCVLRLGFYANGAKRCRR
jgi:tetratricopeptide (TPR) repeat protein